MTDSPATIVGNCTREPTLHYSPSGSAVASFGVAVNHRKKVGDKYEDDPSFFDVTCFGDLAENVGESIQKGTRVIVVGRWKQESWEKDGEKRSKHVLIADEVAASVKFATVVVERVERQGPGHD